MGIYRASQGTLDKLNKSATIKIKMRKDKKMNREILKPQEAADYLGISKVTLYKLLKNGEIPAKKFGNQWRISKAILDKFLEGGER